MIIDSHVHVFDRSVAGSTENFPLWPGTRWGPSGFTGAPTGPTWACSLTRN